MFRKVGTVGVFFLCLLLSNFYCGMSYLLAAPFSQSEATLIFSNTLPASGLHELDAADSPPTHVSLTASGRNDGTVFSSADWWTLKAESTLHWDTDIHDTFYTWSATETDFLVTAAGSASIEFTWENLLDIVGQGASGTYGAYAGYVVRDFSQQTSNEETVTVSSYDRNERVHTFALTYDFLPSDVGQSVSIYRNLEIGHWGADSVNLTTPGSYADFSVTSSLDITALYGGLQQVNVGTFPGQPPVILPPTTNPPAPVPEPATLFLFGCGLVGLGSGIRIKMNK